MSNPSVSLTRPPVVRLQHKYFALLAMALAFGLPTLLASAWGDALGGLMYGGFVLRVLIWHTTFAINSFAHWVGDQRFSKRFTARGNHIIAFFTVGEGE